MPRFLRSLVLAGALALAGCGLGEKNTPDAVQQPKVTKAQLAAMVLSQAEIGTLAAGMKAEGDSGPVGNAQAAKDTVDPEDTGTSLKAAGRVAGHRLMFSGSNLASVRKHGGFAVAGTEVELMEDNVYAAQYLNKQLADYQRFLGHSEDGVKLSAVSSFQVVGIGDEADGLLATLSARSSKFYVTLVAFRHERVIGAASILRIDKKNAQDEARALAVKLDKRIRDVLAGKIEPTPAPGKATKTPKTAKTALSPDRLLPQITLAAADTGAAPILERRTQGSGVVSYSRTFEDVFAKDSHLMRLHAETQLYPTSARAAAAYRLVTSPAGRRAYVRVVLKGFAKQLGAKATDVQVTLVSNLGPNVRGVDVLFSLGGKPYRLTTGFIRSGRAIEAVTGFCTAFAFHPSDLEPLAQRARARLVV